jgi:hypothetical protein
MIAAIIPIIGGVLSIVLGLVGLFRPLVIAIPSGIQAMNELGKMELRAIFGAVFLVLGFTSILFRQPEIYLVAGLVFIGAAGTKAVSLFIDRPPVKLAVPGILFDLFVGLALASGYFF